MKKTNLLLGLFSLMLVFCVVSCGKKDQKAKNDSRFTTKQVEITDEKPEYLLNDMSISGFRVNDTINGIKVNLLCPVVKSKTAGFSTKLIYEISNSYFKNFVAEAKEKGKNDSVFHQLNIRTVFVNSKAGLISCLMEEKAKFVGEEIRKSYFGVTYKKTDDKALSFAEVFPIDEANFDEFKLLFSTKADALSKKDFDESQFAIGKDSLYVFVGGKESSQTKFSAPIQSIEGFIINGK